MQHALSSPFALDPGSPQAVDAGLRPMKSLTTLLVAPPDDSSRCAFLHRLALSAGAANLFQATPSFAIDDTQPSLVLGVNGKEKATVKKTIALLGATGNIGKYVLQRALARGHQVRALTRNPTKLKQQDRLEIVQGSVPDVEVIRRLVQNVDVVVSCLGFSSRTDKIMSTTAAKLLQVMGEQKSPARLVMLTSLGCAGTSPEVKFGLSVLFGFESVNAMDEADRLIREDAKFPYVLVRPPRVDMETTGTGKYSATTAYPSSSPIAESIPVQDLAVFVTDAVEDARWDGNGVQLYSA